MIGRSQSRACLVSEVSFCFAGCVRPSSENRRGTAVENLMSVRVSSLQGICSDYLRGLR